MNALEQVVLGFQSLAHGLRLAFRPSLWVPWLLLLLLQLGAIGALWWFAHPAVSWFAAPAVEALAGENALRYPNVFRLLPALYGRIDLLIASVAGALAIGASTALFGARFAGHPIPTGDGLRLGVSRWGALILANLPVNLLLLGFSYGLDWWIEEREGPQAVHRLAPLLTLAIAVLLQAFFVWINPLLMLGRLGLGAALAALPRAAARGAWTGLTLAIAATVPLLPIQMLARGTEALVDRGTPEIVGWMVVAQALVAVATAFVVTAGSALGYQTLVGPALAEDR